MRTAFSFVLMFAVSAVQAAAQRPTNVRLPSTAQICDMSARAIVIRLVDASGSPVSDAQIAVRRVRTRTRLNRVEALGSDGEYKILEDGTLSDLRRGGEPFDVTFTRGRQTRRVRIILGMDASGCHIALKSGPVRVTL